MNQPPALVVFNRDLSVLHHLNFSLPTTEGYKDAIEDYLNASWADDTENIDNPLNLGYKIRFQSWPRNAIAANDEASISPRDFEWKTAGLAPMMEGNGPREYGFSEGGPPGNQRV